MKKLICLIPFLSLLVSALFAQAGGQNPELIMNRYNSSVNGPTPVVNGDTLGTIRFDGLTATQKIRTGASIRAVVTGPVAPGILQAALLFRTGAPAVKDRMIITSVGRVGIGTNTPAFNLDVVGNTHTSGDFYGRIHMDDNQTADAAPNTYTDEAYLELKQRSVLGVPAGPGTHGGLFTLAPGATSNDHQLFFGNDGIYHRRTTGTAANWSGATWYKLLTGEDINGTPNRIARFTAPNKLGDSQLWDNGAFVGVGTTTQIPGYFFNVNGRTHVAGTVHVTGNVDSEQGLTAGTSISAAQNISAGNDLSVGHNATVNNDLGVGQNIGAGGNMTAGVNMSAAFNMNAGSNISAGQNLNAGNNANISNNAFVGGNLAIGTASMPGTHRLYVAGSMICTEAKVALQSAWPDYVFTPEYEKMPLPEMEQYLQENRHLPGVATAKDVAENGLALGETQRALTEKVEEAFLHLIELEKRLTSLEQQNKSLQAENESLRNCLEQR